MSHRPAIVGLSETKLSAKKWEHLRVTLGFRNCFATDCEGRSGGLALLWHQEVDVSVKSFSKWHIDVEVNSDIVFRLTLFYGNPRVDKRFESWELLKRLRCMGVLPWLVFGDFNEIMYAREQRGARERGQAQMRSFREALSDCKLFDLGWRGQSAFTFSNKRKGELETRARLDRAVATKDWLEAFPNAGVTHGFALTSDHKPIIIRPSGVRVRRAACTSRPFKFEPMWLRDKNFKEKVGEIWSLVRHEQGGLAKKLVACGGQLAIWNKEEFGHVQRRIRALKKELDTVRDSWMSEENAKQEKDLTEELDEWLIREELLWKQRGRMDWLRGGEQNTTFFKAKATQRKERKSVDCIVREDGTEIIGSDDIMAEFSHYFESVFSSSFAGCEESAGEFDLQYTGAIINEDMCNRLEEPYTMEEIRRALFQMHPEKAPGVDGFPAGFYQKF